MTKNWTNLEQKKMIFLLSKLAIYLSPGLHEGLPSYRRILQPPALKNMEFLHFFLFTWEIFALLDPDPAGVLVFRIHIRIRVIPMIVGLPDQDPKLFRSRFGFFHYINKQNDFKKSWLLQFCDYL
jgi:hypothetical protein